jgi:hypothetical protein
LRSNRWQDTLRFDAGYVGHGVNSLRVRSSLSTCREVHGSALPRLHDSVRNGKPLTHPSLGGTAGLRAGNWLYVFRHFLYTGYKYS